MPRTKLLQTSLGACALGMLALSRAHAAGPAVPGTAANLTDGLLAQLLYLPAGLLLAALIVELVARSKSSGSLHRGVFAILIAAVGCSIAALFVTLTSPEKSATLTGSPFAAIQLGVAFTGITLLASIAKGLCFKAHRAAKDLKPKPKKRGRGRGRRRGGSDLRLIADLGYGICLTAAVAASVAAPFFERTSQTLAAISGEEISDPAPESNLGEEQATPPLAEKMNEEEVPEVAVVAEREPTAIPESTISPETEAATPKSDELEMFPDTPAEDMSVAEVEPEPAMETEEEAQPEVDSIVPKSAVRPVSIQQGGLAGADTYNKLVQPILRSRCYSCHDEEKQKGDLRLDTPEHIRKGGKSGAIIIAGNPEKSYLKQLISLDPSDDDIMPPKGKALSAAQISWIGGWIREGADMGDGVAWPVPEGGNSTGLVIDTLTAGVSQTDEGAVQALLDAGVIVRKLSADGKLLEIDLSHADRAAGAMHLEDLAPLASNIHTLDLKRTKVTDADLEILSHMSNLRILHLQRTSITDAALPHLSGLDKLESLNLYNTKVSDAGLAELKKLKSLKKVYLWSTQVTPDGARDLASVLGADVVNMGE